MVRLSIAITKDNITEQEAEEISNFIKQQLIGKDTDFSSVTYKTVQERLTIK